MKNKKQWKFEKKNLRKIVYIPKQWPVTNKCNKECIDLM